MSQFVFNEKVEFKLKEKVLSLSEDSFKIKKVDDDTEPFSVKGNAISLRDSKKMTDADGNTLFKMTESFLTLRGRMCIEDAQTGEKYTLRKKSFIPLMGTSTIQVWKGKEDDGEPYLEVKGNLFRKSFSVKEVGTGTEIAHVKRKSFNIRNLVMEKQSYYISVEPGYDSSFLVFLVVAIDEQYREDEEE